MREAVEQYLMIGSLIIFGATSHALAQLSHARKSELPFDWVDFIIALVISAFAGTLFGIIATFWWQDTAIAHAIAGVGAFLGLKGLNSISEIVLGMLADRAKGRIDK